MKRLLQMVDANGTVPGSVRVCVRVRPLLPSEVARGETSVVHCSDPKTLSVVLPMAAGQTQAPAATGQRISTTLSRSFNFDIACHENFSQEVPKSINHNHPCRLINERAKIHQPPMPKSINH